MHGAKTLTSVSSIRIRGLSVQKLLDVFETQRNPEPGGCPGGRKRRIMHQAHDGKPSQRQGRGATREALSGKPSQVRKGKKGYARGAKR